jgi:hypothetical protein
MNPQLCLSNEFQNHNQYDEIYNAKYFFGINQNNFNIEDSARAHGTPSLI